MATQLLAPGHGPAVSSEFTLDQGEAATLPYISGTPNPEKRSLLRLRL